MTCDRHRVFTDLVEDGDVGFSNTTAVADQIRKPNDGYNQIQATLKLQPTGEASLGVGSTIHFAVKDISVREFPDRDSYDEETVPVPDVGGVRRVDLVKTIDYTIYPAPVD